MIQDILKRQKEKFMRSFVEMSQLYGFDMHNRPPLYETKHDDIKNILNWHNASTKEILEGIVEMEKEKRRKYIPNKDTTGLTRDETHCYRDGYDDSKQDTINYLEQIIKELK